MSQSNCSRLPGITHIGLLPCAMLPQNVADSYLAGIPVVLPSAGLNIPFCGVPICEVSSEYSNNGSLEKATLTFASSQFIAEKAQVAFVITDVNGRTMLIGAREKPFPIIKRTRNTGAPDSDSAVFTYEISCVAIAALVECAG